tara:strand:+ start:439 stop:591 length:153 start_codon:yes stop_codon:yes gene_type:complete
METIAFITVLGVGFVLGLYISSQIASHIDSRTRHKKFMKDMENFDNKKNK